MTGIAKNSVRLVGFGLFIYLVTKILIAVSKLQDEKIAIVTTKKYEQERLFPSMSICFKRKIIGNLSDNSDHALNISRQVKLMSFTLINIGKISIYFRQEVLRGFGHRHTPIHEGLDLKLKKSDWMFIFDLCILIGIYQSNIRIWDLNKYSCTIIHNCRWQENFLLTALVITRLPQVFFAKKE